MAKRSLADSKKPKGKANPAKGDQLSSKPSDSNSEASSASEEESTGAESSDEDALDDENNEFDEEVATDGDSDAGSEDEDSFNDSDDEIPKRKKSKNNDDGSKSFATAFNSIIGSKLKAYNRDAPIMARNKTTLKKLESDKLEAKAKRAILTEKKQLYDKHRVKNLFPKSDNPDTVRSTLEHEKKLKRTAQKGVVRLFNAILSTQVKATQAVNKEKAGETKKKELFNEISKEKFLDMVQAAGDV